MESSDVKDFLIIVAGGGGILSVLLPPIMEFVKRKWAKDDKKEEKEEKQEEATIADIKEELQHLTGEINALTEVNKSLVKAQRTSMVERISYLVKCHIAHKSVSLDDRKQLTNMYDAYKELPGANGDLKPYMQEFDKLPTDNK